MPTFPSSIINTQKQNKQTIQLAHALIHKRTRTFSIFLKSHELYIATLSYFKVTVKKKMEWIKKLLCIKRREPRPYQNGGAIPPFVEDPIETEQEKKERWRSIYVIYFTMFQMSLGFSIVLTGVWPYLDRVSTYVFLLHLFWSFQYL